MTSEQMPNLTQLMTKANPHAVADMNTACNSYLEVFNTGVHYSFIASVVAMFISLAIFMAYKKLFPTPAKKEAVAAVEYTPEEKASMAKEIKQRMYALFAVLGVCVFFWLSFHQNGQSLSVFARDYVITDTIAPEIWQAVNPFFVIVLTPIIMAIFAAMTRAGRAISTPRKIVIGMFITGLLLLPDCGRAVHLPAGPVVCLKNCPQALARHLPGPVAGSHGAGQPVYLDWPGHAQRHAQIVDVLGCVLNHLLHRHGRDVGHGQVAGTRH